MVTGVTRDQESSAALSERKQMLLRLSTAILAGRWDKWHPRAKLETDLKRRSDVEPSQDLKSLNNAFEPLRAFFTCRYSASYSSDTPDLLTG